VSLATVKDAALVERSRGADVEAFEELVRRWSERVWRLALRITGNAADAEEVLQETFLSAYTKLGTFRGQSAFGSWLYRIAANRALMLLRTKRTRSEVDLEEVLPAFDENGKISNPATPLVWDQGDPVHRKRVAAALEAALVELPDTYRVVFLLRDVEGLDTADVAEALELSVPAVKTRLHRARLFLRDRLVHLVDEGTV